MSRAVTATEAARNFSDLLNRVKYRGESFDVVRGGEVVARLTSADSASAGATARALVEALRDAGCADDTFADDLERIQAEQPSQPEDPWAS